MTYIQSNRKGKGGGFKFVILGLFVLFLILNYFKITPFHKLTIAISGPALVIKEKALSPFDNFFAYFKSKKELEKENEELKKEVSNLNIEVLSSEILKYEYKNILNQKEEKESSVEIAKVILKSPFSSFDTLVLGGEFDDSKLGQKVFYRNIIIGEIVEVGSKMAIVKLESSSGNISTAQTKDGNQFEVLGRGNGMYEMILPKDVEVEVGDPVIYPAEEIVLYGFVNEVLNTEDDLFNRVLFNTPVDFKDLNYLRVGTPFDIAD